MLNWAAGFNIFCFLDNHGYQSTHHTQECLLAAGVQSKIEPSAGSAFRQLRDFSDQHDDWQFGHFSYDLKNEIEDLSSENPDHVQFPDLFFFVPQILVALSPEKLSIGLLNTNHSSVYQQIIGSPIQISGKAELNQKVNIRNRISKSDYCRTINQLRQHIIRGDCYEINFCQEFFAEDLSIDPLFTYQMLSESSPMPFAAFYKLNDKFLICASPERYLKKEGSVILTQPIKGTEPRDLQDAELDAHYKGRLFHSRKERAENIMIVDLVRNDLSKVCEESTVGVEELYGIYSFPQVHQMISTVRGKIAEGTHWVDAIKATFPMGSMTGAPKKKVMELIEKYERTKRGLFSGALGYYSPGGNFDFNVVIRSILYNHQKRYLSYQTGSAITFYSDPEMEYEECELKALAIRKVLGQNEKGPTENPVRPFAD